MKANTAIGILLAPVVLMIGVIMEGGNPMAFINIPAFIIVVGGTTMAVFASFSFAQFMRMPKLAILAMTGGKTPDVTAARVQMVKLAEKARRDGLLGLEEDVQQIDDDFTRKGLQLVVDGADSDLVRAVLQSETDGMSQRHRTNAQIFAQAGGFAPTLGILGTVLSLVHVLENLSEPAKLGEMIAGAFIATLYGVGIANLAFLPLGNKLKALSAAELQYREMLLEAILSIQAGDNPRMLAEKLETFLAPADRADGADAGVKDGAAKAEERRAA